MALIRDNSISHCHLFALIKINIPHNSLDNNKITYFRIYMYCTTYLVFENNHQNIIFVHYTPLHCEIASTKPPGCLKGNNTPLKYIDIIFYYIFKGTKGLQFFFLL